MPVTQISSTLADRRLTRLVRSLVINIISTYMLAAIFYADPFRFWEHALSELGTTITLLGTPNLISSLIITLGMFINGRLMLEVARLYRIQDSIAHSNYKSSLMYAASLGSFINIVPNNLYHTIHTVGSAITIGSLFLFDLLLLQECLRDHKPILVYLACGTLCLSVFSYAVTYFLGLPIKQATQKVSVINLLLILIYGARQPLRLGSPVANHRTT